MDLSRIGRLVSRSISTHIDRMSIARKKKNPVFSPRKALPQLIDRQELFKISLKLVFWYFNLTSGSRAQLYKKYYVRIGEYI